jgi:halimadienyl-diphosphate synthase
MRKSSTTEPMLAARTTLLPPALPDLASGAAPGGPELFATLPLFLEELGRNQTTATAYDTAWLACLPDPADPRRPRFPASLAWLSAHQYADGCWGAEFPYWHDRLVCTLRALLTLHAWNPEDPAVAAGWEYIETHAADLDQDAEATIAFELIFPTLLAEAAARGFRLPAGPGADVLAQRAAKLACAPLHLAARPDLPLSVSLEGLGVPEAPAWACSAQEANGGIGLSPAATAYLLQHNPANARAAAYLTAAQAAGDGDGGAPACFPLETFEYGWSLYHLGYALPELHTGWGPALAPLLTFLEETQQPTGWATSCEHAAKEADSTGICYTVLGQAGRAPDPQVLYNYEEETHFRCYVLERNPSISTNAHILSALHYVPAGEQAPRVSKVLRFLETTRHAPGYWVDKWHASPYYATGHVILAAADWAPKLVTPALQWLLQTQQETGGWGWYGATAEETAYAVLALRVAHRHGYPGLAPALERGTDYLGHYGWPLTSAVPALWIHKALYAPVQVVQGAIFAALLAASPQVTLPRNGGSA